MIRSEAQTVESGTGLRLALGLAFTPVLLALAFAVLPQLRVSEAWASVIAFAGAALQAIIGLAISATVKSSRSSALIVALPAVVVLGALAFTQPAPMLAVFLVDSALVCLAWALGASLGHRVQHPAHLFPACVVAASADLVSLLSPEGPSHAIAGSERALSVLAVWFPVAGTRAVAPALGVGDLLFMALVLGVARAHRLPYARSIALCVLGTALAGLLAAWLGVAVPALVPIAAAVVLGLPSIRQLRKEDRKAARWSMLIASSVAAASLARELLARH